MSPALRPGDVLFARPDRRPAAGSVVVFPHPAGGALWLVKRVTACEAGEAWVESDNPEVTMADSRTLGWVSTDDMHRVLARFRPPFSITRL